MYIGECPIRNHTNYFMPTCPPFKFPDGRANAGKPLKNPYRLWAKIYDVCSHNQSHWFVLTTYWGWVFGAFSQGKAVNPSYLYVH